MDIENQEVIYYAADEEYRAYCNIRDKLRIERFLKNLFKSQSHTKNFYKRPRLNKTIIYLFSLK